MKLVGRLTIVIAATIASSGHSADASARHAVPPAAHTTGWAGVRVVDDATGRGVPLVTLKTVDQVEHVTDSQGWAAVDAPGVAAADAALWLGCSADGYDCGEADWLGFRGLAVNASSGEVATLHVNRTMRARRLYRLTGRGIYRDSLRLGIPAPEGIQHAELDAQVVGQDSVQVAVYKGKVRWFWGDTQRSSYPLGNFATSEFGPRASAQRHSHSPHAALTSKLAPGAISRAVVVEKVSIRLLELTSTTTRVRMDLSLQ